MSGGKNNKVFLVIKRRDIGYLLTAVESYRELILSESGKQHGEKLIDVLDKAGAIAAHHRISFNEELYSSGEWTEDKAELQSAAKYIHKLKRYSRLLLQCVENLGDDTVFAKENDGITIGDIRKFMGVSKDAPLTALDCLDRLDEAQAQ